MPAEGLFFDTSYLIRLYLDDHGFEAVRELARVNRVFATAKLAQAEVVSALHRAFRERGMEQCAFRAALDQFIHDVDGGLFQWLPLNDGVQRRLERTFRDAPATVFLRGADALHLACAAEHGFKEAHSNDRHFLAACSLFGLRGVNVVVRQQAADRKA